MGFEKNNKIDKEKFASKVKKKKNSVSNIAAIFISVFTVLFAVGLAAAFWFGSSEVTIDKNNDSNPFFDTEKNNNDNNTDVNNNNDESDTSNTEDKNNNEQQVIEVIRNENSHNILFVGKDRVGSNTDVILLINFNADTQKVNVMQIPRDTFMNSKVNESGRSKRVNAIYAYGSIDTGSVHGGLEELEKAIEDCFAITIDSYFMINLSGFRKIVDAIGGVWVDVPFDMHYIDEEQELYIDLKKGPTLLDGNKAEQFVRFRDDYVEGDMGRVKAQKIFLTAFVEKLLSPEWYTIDKLTNIANYIIEYSTTNIKSSDIAGYLKKLDLSKISSNSIIFHTAPGESYQRSNGAWYYSLYLKENLEIINKAFNVYNIPVEEKHMGLSEESHIYSGNIDIDGKTASEIIDNPPYIPTVAENKTDDSVNTSESNDIQSESQTIESIDENIQTEGNSNE